MRQFCVGKLGYEPAHTMATIWQPRHSTCGHGQCVPLLQISISEFEIIYIYDDASRAQVHGPVLPSSFIGHCEGGVLRFGTTVFFNSEVFSCTYTQCDLYQQACDALPQSTFFVRVSFDAVLEFYRISNSCIYIYILSWMGSWGHSSLKPSAAWGTMQGPSIFPINYQQFQTLDLPEAWPWKASEETVQAQSTPFVFQRHGSTKY